MPHGLRKLGRMCHMECGTPQRVGSHWNVRKPQRGARPRPSAHPWAFFYIVRRLRNAERY